MSDPISEPDATDTDEFDKMQAVMRASERHREGGIDPELTDGDGAPGSDSDAETEAGSGA